MKAFLLAAGLGTRLRPLTDRMPKCLVPLAGRPLLSYWLELLVRHGFTEATVNVHYLPHQVREYLAASRFPLAIRVFDEPELLGSAGTIRANREWIADGAPFLVAYADNLTNADLSALMEAHTRGDALLTMALFRASEPSRCGIAVLDGDRIVGFQEKPERPASNLANAGLYVTDARILDRIPDKHPVDFGSDVLPRLTGDMRGHELRDPLIDVGTPHSYAHAQQIASHLGFDGTPATPMEGLH